MLNIPKKRNIVSCSAPGHKVLLLNSRFSRLDLSEMPAEDALFARSNGAVPVHHDLVFDYDHWTADQVLKAVLPSSLDEVTTSFSTVGHIAHMNLRDEQLEYKGIIGQVILDKNKHIGLRYSPSQQQLYGMTYAFSRRSVPDS